MPQTYLYKARDNNGKTLNGCMEAEDERAVVLRLREQGYLVMSVLQQEVRKNILENFSIYLFHRVNAKHLAIFAREFATILSAGIPLVNCLHILVEQTESKILQQTLIGISRDIESGSNLSKAFSKYPKIFPNLFISMIQVGETTGTLDVVLDRLATYYEKDYDLREKVKSAMAYPGLVLLMSFGIITFLLMFVLPMFQGIFQVMGIQLPGPTLAILSFSILLKNYWFAFLGFFALAFYGFKTYAKTESGQLNLTKVAMLIPVLGVLWKKLSFSRFSMSLAVMTTSGVPILHALEVAKDTLDNKILSRDIVGMQESIRNGNTIASFLNSNKNFPLMMSKMIAVGEMTGSLDTMLAKIASFYEKEVQYTVDRLAALLEPLMIVFLGVVVGGIVLTIMLPILDLVGNIGG